MHLTTIYKAALRIAGALLVCSVAFAQTSSAAQAAGAGGQKAPRFDGKWVTKLTCPPKGNTQGYTWEFPSVIQNSTFRGEHGTEGEPGYLLIEGKIAQNGSAKLFATGIVASREYARGILTHKGEEYSYDIKAQFSETEGKGTRSTGLGIIGRACTFDFMRQDTASPSGER